MAKVMPDAIAAEVRSELRSILRQLDDLRRPLNKFQTHPRRRIGDPRFFVAFDDNPRRDIMGLKIGLKALSLPDERIQDAVTTLAKSVWHLKDRLKRWTRVKGVPEDVEAWADGCPGLLICADLANQKKHGASDNRSGVGPRLEEVLFDTSSSGPVELFYDGASKEKELLVTLKRPITYTVNIHVDGGAVLGDAVSVISDAFAHWLPLIDRIGILGSEAESVRLREKLFPKP